MAKLKRLYGPAMPFINDPKKGNNRKTPKIRSIRPENVLFFLVLNKKAKVNKVKIENPPAVNTYEAGKKRKKTETIKIKSIRPENVWFFLVLNKKAKVNKVKIESPPAVHKYESGTKRLCINDK